VAISILERVFERASGWDGFLDATEQRTIRRARRISGATVLLTKDLLTLRNVRS